jgi:hypothetical protein
VDELSYKPLLITLIVKFKFKNGFCFSLRRTRVPTPVKGRLRDKRKTYGSLKKMYTHKNYFVSWNEQREEKSRVVSKQKNIFDDTKVHFQSEQCAKFNILSC